MAKRESSRGRIGEVLAKAHQETEPVRLSQANRLDLIVDSLQSDIAGHRKKIEEVLRLIQEAETQGRQVPQLRMLKYLIESYGGPGGSLYGDMQQLEYQRMSRRRIDILNRGTKWYFTTESQGFRPENWDPEAETMSEIHTFVEDRFRNCQPSERVFFAKLVSSKSGIPLLNNGDILTPDNNFIYAIGNREQTNIESVLSRFEGWFARLPVLHLRIPKNRETGWQITDYSTLTDIWENFIKEQYDLLWQMAIRRHLLRRRSNNVLPDKDDGSGWTEENLRYLWNFVVNGMITQTICARRHSGNVSAVTDFRSILRAFNNEGLGDFR